MRESFVPFTKVFILPDQNVSAIELTNAEGDLVECNYVKVESVSGGVDAFFYVEAVGVPTTETSFGAANALTGDTSGSLGAVANVQNGTCILPLPPKVAISSINVSHTAGSSVYYAVTYGNVRLANTIADNELTRGY